MSTSTQAKALSKHSNTIAQSTAPIDSGKGAGGNTDQMNKDMDQYLTAHTAHQDGQKVWINLEENRSYQ